MRRELRKVKKIMKNLGLNVVAAATGVMLAVNVFGGLGVMKVSAPGPEDLKTIQTAQVEREYLEPTICCSDELEEGHTLEKTQEEELEELLEKEAWEQQEELIVEEN